MIFLGALPGGLACAGFRETAAPQNMLRSQNSGIEEADGSNERHDSNVTRDSGAGGVAEDNGSVDDTAKDDNPPYRMVDYFTSWSVYARGYRLRDFPGDKFTHLIYAFAQIGADNKVTLFDPNADVVKSYGPEPEGLDFKGNFSQLVALKHKFPHLKTLISVGGWTRSKAFSAMVSSPESRAAFVSSLVAFVDQYRFDGADLDWEYPVEGGAAGNEHRNDDADNFLQLAKELRSAFDGYETTSNRHLELSLAISPNPTYLSHLDLRGLSEYVDFFDLMAYNYAGSWSSTAQHQSPFRAGPGLSVSASIEFCLDAGLLPRKLVVGIPAYGRGFTLSSGLAPETVLGSVVTGQAPIGTWETGSFDYRHVTQGIDEKRPALANPSTVFWDDIAEAPYVYDSDTGLFVSYDDPRSVQVKSLDVWRLGLGGIMFWEISSDPRAELADVAASVLGQPKTTDE